MCTHPAKETRNYEHRHCRSFVSDSHAARRVASLRHKAMATHRLLKRCTQAVYRAMVVRHCPSSFIFGIKQRERVAQLRRSRPCPTRRATTATIMGLVCCFFPLRSPPLTTWNQPQPSFQISCKNLPLRRSLCKNDATFWRRSTTIASSE